MVLSYGETSLSQAGILFAQCGCSSSLQIIIVDTILYVKKIELTPSVFNAINTVLNDKNAQYAITKTTLKIFTVPRGQQSQHIDNAFLGETPKRIAICMMENNF